MPSGKFDFTDFLQTVTADYVARGQVEKTVQNFIDEHACGLCVVTGEPGSGKTVLAAANIRAHNYLHYFLRRGHVEFSLWRDPYAFLATVGYQLWGRYGDSIFPSTVAIDVEGRVRNVAEGGSVVGAEIERLVPLPWQSARIDVDLDAKNIKGEAIGLRVREVVEDYRFLREDTFREIALLEPLRRLAEQRPDEKVVLWVDGLDEESDLQSGGGAKSTITSLLPNAAEVCELGNLLVIASSRPGKHLDPLRYGNAVTMDLSESRFDAENKNTISQVIDQELADAEVSSQLETAHWDKSDLRSELLMRCGDNFLYIRHFFLGVRNDEAETLRANALPSSLNDLHVRLMARVVKVAGDGYPTEMHPVVTMLAVAREPLHIDQLAQLTELDRSIVNAVITKIRPYLDEKTLVNNGHQPRKCYSFFHNAFREMLCTSEHIDEPWYVDSINANGRIADQYLIFEDTGWDGLDDYARNFLTEHLQNASKDHKRRLIEMLDERWRRARKGQSPSNIAFVDDLSRAVECLDSLAPPEILPQAAKLSAMATRVQLAKREIPDGTVALMAKLGQHMRALEYVVPGSTSNAFINRAAEMIKGLVKAPLPDLELLQQMRTRALTSMQSRPDHGQLATLLKACPVLNDPDSQTFINDAIQQYNEVQAYWGTPPALMHIGRLLSVYSKEQAIDVFEQCLNLIPQVSSSAISIYYSELFEVWCKIDPNSAIHAGSEITWRADPYAAKAMLRLQLSVDADDPDLAVQRIVNQFDDTLLPEIQNPYDFTMVQLRIGEAELELGNTDMAINRLTTAINAAKGIGGSDDPDNNSQNRPQMGAEVWIHAAALATDTGFKDSGKLMERAWREALHHGIFNEQDGINRLVRTQYKRSPDLLEARLAKITGKANRAKYMIATADLLPEKGGHAASVLLDQVMSFMEETTPELEHRDNITLAISERMGREKGLTILRGAGIQQEYELDWRFALFDASTTTGENDEDWVLKMLYLWSTSVDNYTLERAAIFATLPDPVIETITGRMESLENPIHRLILNGVLSARIAQHDRKRGDDMLKSACDALKETLSTHARLRQSETLALFAGAWWQVDREKADDLWREALFKATTLQEADFRKLSFETGLAIEAFNLLAPEAALTALLCYNEPPPDPATFDFVIPGPNLSPLVSAGLHKTEVMFCKALANEMADSPSARERFERTNDPAIASATASFAAKRNVGCDLEERMQWCDIALQQADQLSVHYQRCLLSADAADAYRTVGINSRAFEVAASTAQDIIENGFAYGAIFHKPSYANGLGRCLEVLADKEDLLELAVWIWKARVLQNGLNIFMAYLPRLMPEADLEKSLYLLLSANKQASRLFRSVY